MFKTPEFWYKRDFMSQWRAYMLLPFSCIYLIIHYLCSKLRTPKKYRVPIISIGGVTVGGSGKTPVTIALAHKLIKLGKKVHIITRGYGKKNCLNERVNSGDYRRFGDEAILLSKVAITWSGPDKDLLILQAIAYGADVILLDDGAQSFGIKKDFQFLVIDSHQLLGNNWILPAGPLREPLSWVLKRSDALVSIGRPIVRNTSLPVIKSRFINKLALENEKIVAFCGIGYPDKFFKSLSRTKNEIVEKVIYSDHHDYDMYDLEYLVNLAKSLNAKLVTTEKDFLKIPLEFRDFVYFMSVVVNFVDFDDLLLKRLI